MRKEEKKSVIEEELAEELSKVVKICNENRFPMFFTAAIQKEGEKTKYVSKALLPEAIGVKIKDDRFADLVNVMNGFSTIPPIDDIEIEM